MARRARNASGALLESGFQGQVIGLARFYGWRVYHAPDNRPAGESGRAQRLAAPEAKGFPDLVLVRGAELLFVELKTDTGRLGPGQQEWLDALGEVGQAVESAVTAAQREYGDPLPGEADATLEALLWRPRDWHELEQRLARGRHHVPMPAPE